MTAARYLTTASLIGLAASVLFAPSMAAAQSVASEEAANEAPGDAEIVVTAQRRDERNVDVPITIANLSAAQLETANVQELADISKITPSLRFDNAGAFFQPTIRGIGTAVTTSGGGGNVGIYIDGFYSPNPLATNTQLMNVRSIQVLKGPQGTLFGRNTTGGAILIQSADPSTEPGAEVKLSYGRFNELRGQGYATMGISDTVAIDIEGLYRRGDGWQRDLRTGQRVGAFENWSARLGLKADLSDNVSVLLRYQHSEVDDPSSILTNSYIGPEGSGAPLSALPGEFTYDPDFVVTDRTPEYFRSTSDTIQGTIRADLGFANLTSYTQYRKEKVDASIELDYSGANVFQLGLPNENQTFSQELLLTSKSGSRLQWTAGLFYFFNDDIYIVHYDDFPLIGINNTRVRAGGSGTRTSSYAAFLDATYEITPKLFITAGARYSHDSVTNAYYCQPGTGCTVAPKVPDISGDKVTPRVVVRYKPSEESSIYASYTKGYKAAIIDVGGSCQAGPAFVCNDVKPEDVDAFEVGFKYSTSGLSFDIAGFYYDYKQLQVSTFIQGTANITNAASSEIYGIDGQIRYDFNENFQVSAGAAWVHARYKRFENAPIYVRCTFGAACSIATFLVDTTQTLTNVTMQRTPEFTGNIGARYRTDLGGGRLQLSGNLFYSSSFFFGPSGIQFPQKGYEVLSLRAEWTDPSDRFSIAAWGDNVTNSRYLTQAQYNSPGIGANWSKPTTFGIELGAKF